MPRNADSGLHERRDAIPSSLLRRPALARDQNFASERPGDQLRAKKDRTRHSSERALVLRSASMLALPRQNRDSCPNCGVLTLQMQHMHHVQSRISRRALPRRAERGGTADPPASQRARLAKLSAMQADRRLDSWRLQPHDLPMRAPILLRLWPALEDVPL